MLLSQESIDINENLKTIHYEPATRRQAKSYYKYTSPLILACKKHIKNKNYGMIEIVKLLLSHKNIVVGGVRLLKY